LQPFSFVNICTALGFNSDYIRRSVLHVLHRQRPLRLHRYAAKVEESWLRQRRPIAKMPTSTRRVQLPSPGVTVAS